MKLALIHDHLTQNGGAERVLEAFQAIWPNAPTFTLIYDQEKMASHFGKRDIRTSFLQRMPLSLSKPRWYLPLMPTATESYDLSDYDVIVSSSSAFSKGVIPATNAIHICYCHTPTRYLWSDSHSYVEELNVPGIVKRILPPVLSGLRAWDRLAAERVDYFIANSETVRHRIKRYYQKESDVIHPPVEFDEFAISDAPKTYYLIGGRLVAYKRYDLVVQAFSKLNIPLKIYGTGPMEQELKRMAGPNVQFLGRVSNEQKAHLFSNAIAFLHPQEEDFGITPLESMAAGRPVIAYGKGGALETVIDGKTGVLFNEQSWEEIADTVLHFEEKRFDPNAIRKHAENFSLNRFHREMRDYVEEKWRAHAKHVIGTG